MIKYALIGIAALGLIAGAATAQAKMDCAGMYKGALDKMQAKAATLPGDKLAETHRLALRAYDACSAGDEFNATKFFQQLSEEAR